MVVPLWAAPNPRKREHRTDSLYSFFMKEVEPVRATFPPRFRKLCASVHVNSPCPHVVRRVGEEARLLVAFPIISPGFSETVDRNRCRPKHLMSLFWAGVLADCRPRSLLSSMACGLCCWRSPTRWVAPLRIRTG